MAKKQTDHTHKLRRHRYSSGNVVYFCALPDCSYKITPALALGKRALCWRCGEEFILNEYAIRLAKPHCENCHKPKKELLDLEVIDNEIIEFIPLVEPVEPRVDTASDLRSRLTGVLHKAEEEGDI